MIEYFVEPIMPPSTLNLAGQKFVVIPQSEYRRLKARAARNGSAVKTKRRLTRQDRGDIAEAKRSLADPRRITHQQLRARVGWDESIVKSEHRLTRQDRGDIAEALRRRGEPTISADELARELGFDPEKLRTS